MMNVLYICTDDGKPEGSTLSLLELIRSVRESVNPIVICSGTESVMNVFQSEGIETFSVPLFLLWEQPKRLVTAIHHPSRSATYRYVTSSFHTVHAVRKALAQRSIDIVHTNTSVVDVGHYIAHAIKARHVWHIRESLNHLGIKVFGGMHNLQRKIENADARIVISHALKKEWCFSDSNTFVVHDAIVQSLPNIGEITRDTILFCAATINDYKGADLAVKVFCRASLGAYTLTLVGECDEDYRQKLVTIANSYGLADRLRFTGYLQNLEPIYRKAAALLMCSRYEGLGRVSLEAMAYGCPVVALARGGTLDFIHHNTTGYLFNTEQEGVDCLRESVKRPPHVVSAARELIAEEYSETTYGKKIASIYNTLVCHTYRSE